MNPHSSRSRSLRPVIAILVLCVVLGGAAACTKEKEIVSDTHPGTIQGWTDQERLAFYHTSQGTKLIPYAWFLALEQLGHPQPFRLDENLARFGFIPDRQDKVNNPDGLPIGFAKTDNPGSTPWLGLNCAACHTGRITYGGQRVIIDGGASLQNNILFMRDLGIALSGTIRNNEKFLRFAQKVLGEESNGPKADLLRAAVKGYLGKLISGRVAGQRDTCQSQFDPPESHGKTVMQLNPLDLLRRLLPDMKFVDYVEGVPYSNWGYGRLDALGRGRNTVFFPLDPCNLERADAPVSIPKVWYAWKYDWVQWNGSVENPLARNLAQAVALGAIPPDLKALDWFETLLHKLTPPVWRESVLGIIDKDKAMRGKALYYGQDGKGLCAHCHVPKIKKGANTENERREECKEGGGEMLEMNIIPYVEVGTDPLAAVKFSQFPVLTGSMEREFGQRVISQPKAMERITTEKINEGLMRQSIPTSEGKRMQRCRTNRWQSPEGYKAPTHEGVWATAPYLHNGSVPNLYQLLLPVEQRDQLFCVGPDLEFDPKHVGLKSPANCPDQYRFQTAQPGNHNSGHEFRNTTNCQDPNWENRGDNVLGCEIKEEDRWAIVEYLKTL